MSAIDGRTVNYRGKENWVGLVQGDSYIPGTVRVQWNEPRIHTGIHRVEDLVAIDTAEENLVKGGWEMKETPWPTT